MEENKRWNRGSIVFPVILIAIGLIVLLTNLGAIRGNAWDIILVYWPVLLIAFGLDGLYKREGIVGPVFLIGLGIVFLLSNLGFLTVDVWQMVLRLWPVLLIAFGLDVLIGRRSMVLSVVGLFIMLAVLIGALWLFGATWSGGQVLPSEDVRQPIEGASEARIVIKPAAGYLRIDALTSPENLVEGTVQARRSERVTQDFSREGATAVFTLQGAGSAFIGPTNAEEARGWQLALTPAIPIALETGIGAGMSEIDLTDLMISDLNVSVGVGETTVILPETGRFQGEVQGAIGQIIILVPEGMELAIDADTGIASLDIPDDFLEEGDRYTSPGYATAQNRIDLKVGQAIGNIEIRRR
jgi:hypothetical protein